MAIVKRSIGSISGDWDDFANKWASPPAKARKNRKKKPASATVDRNIIVTIFLEAEGSTATLDAWQDSSATIDNYFAVESFQANRKGLDNLILMTQAAQLAGHIVDPAASRVINYFKGLKTGLV